MDLVPRSAASGARASTAASGGAPAASVETIDDQLNALRAARAARAERTRVLVPTPRGRAGAQRAGAPVPTPPLAPRGRAGAGVPTHEETKMDPRALLPHSRVPNGGGMTVGGLQEWALAAHANRPKGVPCTMHTSVDRDGEMRVFIAGGNCVSETRVVEPPYRKPSHSW